MGYNLLKKSALLTLEVMVAPIMLVLATPILLKYLGTYNYGVYLLILSISISMNLINQGIPSLIVKKISEFRHKNIDDISKFYSTVFVFQLSLILILLLLLLAMLLGASLFDSGSDGSIIKKLLLLSIPMMLIEMLSFNLISIHRGYERFDRALLASLFEKVVKYGVLIYVVIATSNMFYIFMYGLLSAAFLFVAHSVLIKCWYREIFFFKYCSYDMLSSIKAISVWAWVLGMVGLISLQLDKWFVGYYFGYEILAVYGLAIMIFGQLHTFNSASIAWILPEVSKNGFTKENVRRYSTLPIYILMSSCLAVFLVHKFEFLFISWLGAEQYSSAEKYIDVATALLPVYAATLVPQYYLVATGMFKKHTQIDSVILITKGILLITVVRLFDVYHVAYILCTLALISSFMYQFELYKVGLKSKNIIIQLVTPLMGFIVTLSILNSLI